MLLSVVSFAETDVENNNVSRQADKTIPAMVTVSKEQAEIETSELARSKPVFSSEKKTNTKPSVAKLSNWPMVILMLLGIVCLILALAWFVKRFGGLNMAGGRDMRVLSSVALGARERVAIIDVKGQQFLLGVTTQNINHLHTFDSPVMDVSKKGANNSNTHIQKSDFSEKLQQLLKTAKPSSDDRV